MEYTGERYLPWVENAQAAYEHLHRYLFALPFVKGRRVLDLATGEGYGAAMLSESAREVVGIDIDAGTISHAASRYTVGNLSFLVGSIVDVPASVGADFDVVTCFEAIEHVEDYRGVVREARRLLNRNGLFFVSTPNKLVFSDEVGRKWPWHAKEFYLDEFREVVQREFAHAVFLGQRVFTGSSIWQWLDDDPAVGRRAREAVVEKGETGFRVSDPVRKAPMFFLAVATNGDARVLRQQIGDTSYLVDLSHSLMREKDSQIQKLAQDIPKLQGFIESKEADLGKVINEAADLRKARDAVAVEKAAAEASLLDLRKAHQDLQAQTASEMKMLQRRLEEASSQRVDLQNVVRDLQAQTASDLATMQSGLEQAELQNADLQQLIHDLQAQAASDLSTMQSRLEEASSQSADLRNQISALRAFLERKEEDIRIAVEFIQNLHASRGFRALLRYWKLIDRMAPQGTRRRKAYNASVSMAVRAVRGMIRLGRQVRGRRVALAHALGDAEPTGGGLPSTRRVDSAEAVACTVASKNYLPFVRVWARSVREHNPGLRVFVLLVDRVQGEFDPGLEPYEIVYLEELDNIPNREHFWFKYNALELNTAVKPYFFEHLFDRYQARKLAYFDPDIVLFRGLSGLWELLEAQAIILTPHITQGYTDDAWPTELEINQAGIFNLGFIAMKKSAPVSAFLKWWQRKLYDGCVMDHKAGLHVDQKWVNLAPVMFDGVFVLKDSAFNIAYWNLHSLGRRLRYRNGKLLIDGRPAVFFHFSGFDPANIEAISIHQNRFALSDFPNLRPLLHSYADLLLGEGYRQTRGWDYAFGRFDNGVRIPEPARMLYRSLGRKALSFGDPFRTGGPSSFYNWLTQPADDGPDGSPPISRLGMQIHALRSDLQRAYPDPFVRHRQAFWEWLVANAESDFGVSKELIPGPGDGRESRPEGPRDVESHGPGEALRSIRWRLKPLAARIVRAHPGADRILRGMDKRLFPRRAVPARNAEAPPRVVARPFGVNVAGYIQGEFGVAEVARASIASLRAAGVPCALNNIVTEVHRYEDTTYSEFSNSNPYAVNLIHVNADQMPSFREARGDEYFAGRRNIAVWFWELSTFPARWLESFRGLDEIWVATGFCQQSIANASPVPVLRLPFPILVDERHAVPDRKRFGLPEEQFIFLFSFDYLSVFERKNPLAVVEAFRSSFERDQGALLVIKTINSSRDPENCRLVEAAARGLSVKLIDQHLSRQDNLRLTASCDCYVSLHRSEGYGVGMAEAMYLRKPVVATAYSGNMEFMNVNNAFPVRYDLVELSQDFGPYQKGNVWAEPDVEHAAELMRMVYGGGDDVVRKCHRAASDIQTHLNPHSSGLVMLGRLRARGDSDWASSTV